MERGTLLANILLSATPLIPLYLGIYLVFLMRNDFDLTLQGTFPVGGAIVAELLEHHVSIYVALLVAILGGGGLGVVTAFLHSKLKIPVFLAGLVMSIALYTVALRIMQKQPTISLLGTHTLFDPLKNLHGDQYDYAVIGVLAVVVGIALVLVAAFLKTEVGLAVRASGINTTMARSNGFNDKTGVSIALFIANALSALSGALVVQTQGFADVGMGNGVAISGLGGIVIGALVFRPTSSRIVRIFLAVISGALVYETVVVLSLQFGLDPVDLNLVTALTLVVAIVLQMGVRRATATIRGHAVPEFRVMRETTGTDLARTIAGGD